ncbi:hypothetical protein QBC37DRAFT_121817 [Rhypophila decipiens]|uniref:Uncharacterized protein n=1 Tax=Rhypophila decipiens TaxID=261697 RepID=A0AAN7B998_9PEZI|nr:hypothetical protein QBC37DRAFT_121817 [Rhypophila decipiens]
MAADFLRKVAVHLRDEIDNNIGRQVLEVVPLDLVVSYPSLWPEAVKPRYFHVIESAFDLAIVPRLRHIYFLAEAEAVSQWCVFSKLESLCAYGIRKGTSVIVCDTTSDKGIATSYGFDHILRGSDFNLRKIGYLARANAGRQLVEAGFKSLCIVRLNSTAPARDRLLETSDPDSTVDSL